MDVQNRPGVGVIVEGSDNVVEDWICEMAGIVRNYIQGGILVGSGGSQTFIQSLNSQSSLMSTCESLDIITVSDSGLDLSLSSDVSYVSRALGLVGAGISKKKQVVLEGICMQPPAPPSISSSLQYKYEENVKLVLNMTLAAGVSWVGTEVNNDEAGFISTSSSDIGCTTSRFNSIDSDWIQNIL